MLWADKDSVAASMAFPSAATPIWKRPPNPPEGSFYTTLATRTSQATRKKAKPGTAWHRAWRRLSGYAYYCGYQCSRDRRRTQMMHARVMRLVTDTLGQVIA